MEMQTGSVVFFTRAKCVAHGGKKKEFEFKGHGYGILLGIVPHGAPPPPIEIVIANLGAIGYAKLDDINEFLGEEQGEIFLKKWQEKYTALIQQIAEEAVKAGKLKLIGPDGKPLSSAKAQLAIAAVPAEETEEYLKGSERDRELNGLPS